MAFFYLYECNKNLTDMLGRIVVLILIVYWGFTQNSCYGIFSPDNDLNDGYFYGITKAGNYLYAVASEYDTAGTRLNTIYKFDNSLNIIKSYNIPFNDEVSFPKITATNDGNVIITGTIYYDTFFEPLYKTAFITKFSSSGTILWDNAIGVINGELYPADIITLKDGSYIVVGYAIIADTLRQEWSGAILRISDQGQILWSKKILTGLRTVINDVTPAQDGNFYITGEFLDTTISRNIGFVAKLSPTGSLLWIKKFSYNLFLLEGISVTETYNKNVVVVGMIDTTLQDYYKDALIVMLSPTGQKLWSKFYSSDTNGTGTIEYATLVKELNRNIVITIDGVPGNKLLTLDMQGNMKSNYKLNNSTGPEDMLNNYNEVVIAGSRKTPYLIKYNPADTFCSNCGTPATGYVKDINVNLQTLTGYTIKQRTCFHQKYDFNLSTDTTNN